MLEEARRVEDERKQPPVGRAEAADANERLGKESAELGSRASAQDTLDRLAKVDSPIRTQRGER